MNKNIKALVKLIFHAVLIWFALTLIVYLISGSFKASIPIAILIVLGTINYFHMIFKNYKK